MSKENEILMAIMEITTAAIIHNTSERGMLILNYRVLDRYSFLPAHQFRQKNIPNASEPLNLQRIEKGFLKQRLDSVSVFG